VSANLPDEKLGVLSSSREGGMAATGPDEKLGVLSIREGWRIGIGFAGRAGGAFGGRLGAGSTWRASGWLGRMIGTGLDVAAAERAGTLFTTPAHSWHTSLRLAQHSWQTHWLHSGQMCMLWQ